MVCVAHGWPVQPQLAAHDTQTPYDVAWDVSERRELAGKSRRCEAGWQWQLATAKIYVANIVISFAVLFVCGIKNESARRGICGIIHRVGRPRKRCLIVALVYILGWVFVKVQALLQDSSETLGVVSAGSNWRCSPFLCAASQVRAATPRRNSIIYCIG